MNYSVLLLSLLLSVSLIACGGAEHDHHEETPDQLALSETTAHSEASDEFATSFADAVSAYLDLKDALVETDAATAREKAEYLHAKLEDVSHEGLADEDASFWENTVAEMRSGTENITTEEDVEEQRYQFEYVSNAFIATFDRFGNMGMTVYQQTCPMVRGGSADWISAEGQVMNPYHGERMMNCGSVVRTF